MMSNVCSICQPFSAASGRGQLDKAQTSQKDERPTSNIERLTSNETAPESVSTEPQTQRTQQTQVTQVTKRTLKAVYGFQYARGKFRVIDMGL